MNLSDLDIISVAAMAGLALLSVAIALCFVRLWIGPSLPDRVVALDAVATLLVGFLVLIGIANGEAESIRIATLLALVTFVGTIGFAFYLRKRQIQ